MSEIASRLKRLSFLSDKSSQKFDLELKKIIIFEEFMLRVKYQTFMECIKNHYDFYYKKLNLRPKLVMKKNEDDNLFLDVNGQFEKHKFDIIKECQHEKGNK